MAFYGNVRMGGQAYGGFGLLPAFDSQGDPLLAASVSEINPQIAQAQNIQGQITSLIADPDGADLASVVSGLEAQIANAWQVLKADAVNMVAAKQERDATFAEPKPDMNAFNYSGGAQWYAKAVQDWLDRKNEAIRIYSAGLNTLGAHKDVVKSLLSQYIGNVPAAAKGVADLRAAKVKAQTASLDVSTTAKQTQAFVAQQELQTAVKKAAASAAAVAEPGMSPLVIAALVGVPVLGVIAYALSRKKSSSVAGYRRRKRSRRSRR